MFFEGGFLLLYDGLYFCDYLVDFVGFGLIGYFIDVWKVFEID